MDEDRADDVGVVRALFLAYAEGRFEDMLLLVHPDVVWQPLTRPGRSVYRGHAGTSEMLADMARARGSFRLEFEDFVQLDDGRVKAAARIVQLTSTGEVAGPRVEPVLTVVDGLVIRLESDPAQESGEA